MTLFLSRLRIARHPSNDALRPLIDPVEGGRRLDAHHRLIWAAFADGPDRRRDFLWRDEGRGRFTVLSARPPMATGLFEPPEVKPFAPVLAASDRLRFDLRANATKALRDPEAAARGRRVDVVMNLLHEIPSSARAERRPDAAQAAGAAWLAEQGARHGFAVRDVAVGHYDAVTVPGHVGGRKGAPRLGIMDLSGELEVTNPDDFLAAQGTGFGRAKAFGCGLMLIRRA